MKHAMGLFLKQLPLCGISVKHLFNQTPKIIKKIERGSLISDPTLVGKPNRKKR
jgi:hypothetical protein